MLTESLKVAIVGGGPTGLATALALLKGAQIANMAVFEADTFTPKGASIVISKPGLDALGCIDPQALKEVKKDGAPVCALFFKDFAGRHRLPLPVRWLVWMLYPLFRIFRIGIVKANAWYSFRDILRRNAVDASLALGYDLDNKSLIRSNKKLVNVDTATSNDSVELSFQDGTKVNANIVLACDGAFSTVRKCLAIAENKEESPFLIDEDRTVWRGTAPNMDTHNRATFYVNAPRGSGEGSSATGALFPAGNSVPGSSLSIVLPSVPGRAVDSNDAKIRLNKALAPLEPIDPILRDAIESVQHMLEHKLHVRDFDAHPNLASGHGRIAYLGDSAHPLRPTGEGVALALEDAWTMGRLAKENKGALTPQVLQQYVQERQKRVTRVCGAIREFAETFYDDEKGARAVKSEEAKDGTLKTTKTSVKTAMKNFPIDLKPLV